MLKNKSVQDFVNKAAELLSPQNIVIVDGSKSQLDMLRKEACDSGELIELNQEKMPGCYLHRTAQNDVARVEDKTFICTKNEYDAGPTNNWMAPDVAYKLLSDIMKGRFSGKTMYIIPYSMGPINSPFSKIGIEITDSIYVVLNIVHRSAVQPVSP